MTHPSTLAMATAESSGIRPILAFAPPTGAAAPVTLLAHARRAQLATRPTLASFMLRPFEVLVDGAPIVAWPSQKAKSILKLLLLRPGHAVAKAELLERIWPDRGAAENNLHVAICHLRKVVPFVELDAGNYRLVAELEIWTDVDEFERGLARALVLARAGQVRESAAELSACAELYRNELLAEDARDAWIAPLRQRLRDLHLDALLRLAHHHFDAGNALAGSGACTQILAIDACNETAHRLLLHSYAARGQPNLVQLQYRSCVSTLAAQLGVSPSAQTTELYRRLARGA